MLRASRFLRISLFQLDGFAVPAPALCSAIAKRKILMQYKPDPSNYKELLPGIFMKALTYGDNSLLCEFQLKQGAIIPAHQHPQEQIGYLVQGSLRFFGDEGEAIVLPGCS